MEAVPRMPMIWLELKEAGEFNFSSGVRQYIHRNYGENPENYSEALRKLEQLRKNVVNAPKDFEGCNALRKYFAQLNFLQSRVPMAKAQEAAAPVTWFDIYSGKKITHEDINYEQACVLYNLGALHSYLGAMDNRVSDEGMKTSCTHFQGSAGAFTYIRDNYNNSFSSDMNHQALCVNISLMLAQAQECLLEKTLLDNRKNSLIARVCAQVCDYYKDCARALDCSEGISGKKDWKKLILMKISYFSAITHLHMGKNSEEQQKFGEAVAYFQSALDKLNEAIRQSKGQPDSVQDALRFTLDVVGGKFNSAKKDNEFIYHASVPALDTLPAVKGASLVKPIPVTLTDPGVTGPDLFSKLVPMVAHEASSLYSEEKAKLLREVTAKIEDKNQSLERFMDSLNCDSVDNLDMFNTLPPALLEKCAALSVRGDTVKALAHAMQALSSVYTDVGSYLEEARSALEEDEVGEKSLLNVVGQEKMQSRFSALKELQTELKKYETVHQSASQNNTELHGAMNQHIPNLRLLQGPLDELKKSLPQPHLSQDDTSSLQTMKRLLGKVDDMRKQRISLEKQLRELIQKDDLTSTLVITERFQMKSLFEEQLKKYDQLKGFAEQNLTAQENILKALTEANVQYATVRKTVIATEQQWNSSVQSIIASYEAFEDLLKKANEGTSFYQDLEKKTTSLLDRVKTFCQHREKERKALLGKEIPVVPPRRSTAPKPVLGNNVMPISTGDVPQELLCNPPDMSLKGPPLPTMTTHVAPPPNWPPALTPSLFSNPRMPQLLPFAQSPYSSAVPSAPAVPLQSHLPNVGLPQQFQAGRSVGTNPAPLSVNSQVPPQGYFPAPMQKAPIAPYLGGQQVSVPGGPFTYPSGQQMPPGIPQSPSSFPSQPPQAMISAIPRAPFPGQFQPPLPAQNQPIPGPNCVQWAPVMPHPPSQAPLPAQSNAQLQSGLPNPFPQGHIPQNNPNMGHILTPFPSHPGLGSFQNTDKPTAGPLPTPQNPFEQNAQMPFAYQSSNPSQLPTGLQQGSGYFQAGTAHSPANLLPGQNAMSHPTAAVQFNPILPGTPPPNPNSPSSGSVNSLVMDDPNPPVLSGILTPSPAQAVTQNPTFKDGLTAASTETVVNNNQGGTNQNLLSDTLGGLNITHT